MFVEPVVMLVTTWPGISSPSSVASMRAQTRRCLSRIWRRSWFAHSRAGRASVSTHDACGYRRPRHRRRRRRILLPDSPKTYSTPLSSHQSITSRRPNGRRPDGHLVVANVARMRRTIRRKWPRTSSPDGSSPGRRMIATGRPVGVAGGHIRSEESNAHRIMRVEYGDSC